MVDNWSIALGGPSAEGEGWLFLHIFFFFFYTILTSTGRGASAVDNSGSPYYGDRQYERPWAIFLENRLFFAYFKKKKECSHLRDDSPQVTWFGESR